MIGASPTVLLWKRGWVIERLPCRELSARLNSVTVEPFDVFRLLAQEKLTAEDWRKTCVELGVLSVDLGALSAAVPPPFH